MTKLYKYDYLWPTRPEKSIPKEILGFYKNLGWTAQVKKNGTCNVIFVTDKDVIFKTRHNDNHKQWSPNKETIEYFRQFPAWTVFNAELLHNKTPNIKNVNYIHDIVAYDGNILDGVSFIDRQNLLHSFVTTKEETFSHYKINDVIWITKNHTGKFKSLFDQTLEHEEDEGLVLKDTNSKLSMCYKQKSNVSWLVKCRKPTKNYSF